MPEPTGIGRFLTKINSKAIWRKPKAKINEQLNIMSSNIVKQIVDNWERISKEEYKIEPDFPDTLMLEITNACNLKCIMCQQKNMKRKIGYISLDLVNKILPEAKKSGIKRIALYTTGEPLLHPKFTKIVEICKSYDFYCYTTSNGILLDAARCRELVKSGLDSIKISIDGSNREEYNKIRKGGDFDRLLKNIGLLKRLRDQHQSHLSILASAVVMNINENSLTAFREKFDGVVDDVLFSPIVNQSGSVTEKYLKLKPKSLKINSVWSPCRMLWDRMVLSYDGRITACCVDYELKLAYADCHDSTLKDAWHSDKIKQLRRAHKTGNISNLPLCRYCNAPFIQTPLTLQNINK